MSVSFNQDTADIIGLRLVIIHLYRLAGSLHFLAESREADQRKGYKT
jgi:hypothetical protein